MYDNRNLSVRWGCIWLLFGIHSFFLKASYGTLTVYNELQCEDYCLKNEECGSYKLGVVKDNGKIECFIFPKKTGPLKLRAQIALSCDQNPCKHGGKCIPDTAKCRRIVCNCKKNWTGATCDVKIKDVEDGIEKLSECDHN